MPENKTSCPMCKNPVTSRIAGIWPFCSARCKEIDLGNWARGAYLIAGQSPAQQQSEESELDLNDTPAE